MKQVNKVGPKVLAGIPIPEHLPASQLPDLIAAGKMVIDTRLRAAFAASHFPATINIPRQQPIRLGWLVCQLGIANKS